MSPPRLQQQQQQQLALFVACFFFLATTTPTAVWAQQQPLFDNCDSGTYYSSLTSTITPTRADLHQLLQTTHRRILPYTAADNTDDDVWKAMADLHPGATTTTATATTGTNTVRLIYTQQDVAVDLAGDTDAGWNREHLWPSSRGVGGSGAASFTDIHHIVPSDWNVNSARGNKYFGSCGVGGGTCTIPAHVEATNDTAASRNAFLPPASVRGDIARALLYMDVRYEGTSSGERDLYLTDCPGQDDSDTGMAYLSELLAWHAADPVDAAEIERNNKACERWQGNRNPFIDYPSYAEYLFGTPQTFPFDCDLDDPGVVPCVGPGAVMVVGVNSDNPDTIAMVAMEYLPPGMLMFATDNAWIPAQQDFTDTEGIIMLRVPEGGIRRGTVFGFGEDQFVKWQWEDVQGNFLLSASGDTVLMYCRDSQSGLQHIGGFSYGGYWDDRGGDSTKSALPEALTNVSVTLYNHADNYRYVGTTQGNVDAVREAIRDPDNWEPNNDQRFTDFESMTFRLSGVDSSTTSQSTNGNTSGIKTLPGSMFGVLLALVGCVLL